MLLKKKKLSCIIQAQKTKKKTLKRKNMNVNNVAIFMIQSTGYAQSMDLKRCFCSFRRVSRKFRCETDRHKKNPRENKKEMETRL